MDLKWKILITLFFILILIIPMISYLVITQSYCFNPNKRIGLSDIKCNKLFDSIQMDVKIKNSGKDVINSNEVGVFKMGPDPHKKLGFAYIPFEGNVSIHFNKLEPGEVGSVTIIDKYKERGGSDQYIIEPECGVTERGIRISVNSAHEITSCSYTHSEYA